jgi:hypothetical protein
MDIHQLAKSARWVGRRVDGWAMDGQVLDGLVLDGFTMDSRRTDGYPLVGKERSMDGRRGDG